MSCLKLMSETLKRDICNLQQPGTLISKADKNKIKHYLPSDVQYACCYWVEHLQHSKVYLCDNYQVYKFLQEHFLHRLEVLMVGKMSDGVLMVAALQSMIIVSDSTRLFHKHEF
jgi:hypothetical protein